MIVVGDRSTEHGREPIAELLADDAAKLPYGASHRGKCRLDARDGRFGLKLGNQIRGGDHVGPKDRHEPALAIGISVPVYSRPASGAPITVRIRCRLAREAKHFCISKGGSRISAQYQLRSFARNRPQEKSGNGHFDGRRGLAK
jgi:hypothetical protein